MRKPIIHLGLFFVVMLAACGESPVGVDLGPSALSPDDPSEYTVSNGKVYWINNVAHYPDDVGNSWKWVREGSGGVYPRVRLYRNGVYVARYNISYSGSVINGDVLMEAETQASMTHSSSGSFVSADAGHPFYEPHSGFEPLDPVVSLASAGTDCDSAITYSVTRSCNDEYDQMRLHAAEAAAVGALGGFLTSVTGGLTAGPAVWGFGVATLRAVNSLATWARCKWLQE